MVRESDYKRGKKNPENWVGKTFYILIVVVVTWVYLFGQSHNIAHLKWVQLTVCKLFLNYLNKVDLNRN